MSSNFSIIAPCIILSESVFISGKVYIDSNGSDQPIVGCINGYNWIVPTGEEVEIPTCIYDVIKDVRRMKVEADKAAKEFLDGAKKLD